VRRMLKTSKNLTEQRKIKERLRRSEASLALAENKLRRLSQRSLDERDQERRKMARDLHESAGQTLAALKMTLGSLRKSLLPDNQRALPLLQSAVELTEDAIRELRTVAYLMHPPLLDEAGLGPALRWYARGFAERSGIQVAVEVPETFGRLSQDIETAVFRVVQEALTNVHRYSGSRVARVCLAIEDGHIRIEVQDEGCGIAPHGAIMNNEALPGVGIAGMRERITLLNGTFELETSAGVGTTVRAILPVALVRGRREASLPLVTRQVVDRLSSSRAGS
jgi:signal transduction histidine kinase